MDYSVSKSALLDLLRAEGVVLRRQRMAQSNVELAVRWYAEGQSMAKIAARLDTSYNNVRENLLRAGVSMRSRGGSHN